jgi:glycosyltransferase involved in cell wall biosynthesis
MSIALLHGMAAGLPCVVTSVGDNPLLVIHGDNGLVVAPEKVNELVNALQMLLVDEALCKRMSQASELMASRYSDVQMVRDLEMVYNECCPL